MSDPQDLSQRALSLARAIDRLPPGEYSIILIKHGLETKDWFAEINRCEVVQNFILKNKSIKQN
jgi:hypothetical protein